MITEDEKNYLAKIDPTKIVRVYPFNSEGQSIALNLVNKIKAVFPQANVLFMGSTALGIAGQKDIDIYILDSVENFEKYLPKLESMFGQINKSGDYIKKKFVEWKFVQDEYDIEIYLTEPPERQIKVFEILRDNHYLLKEYEELKFRFDGKSYKDYQTAKYHFFNKILPDN